MRNHCFTFKSNSLFYIIHFPFIKWILIYLFIYFGRGGGSKIWKKHWLSFPENKKIEEEDDDEWMSILYAWMKILVVLPSISSSIFFLWGIFKMYTKMRVRAHSHSHTHTHKLHTQIYTPLLHFTSLHFLLFTILFLWMLK